MLTGPSFLQQQQLSIFSLRQLSYIPSSIENKILLKTSAAKEPITQYIVCCQSSFAIVTSPVSTTALTTFCTALLIVSFNTSRLQIQLLVELAEL